MNQPHPTPQDELLIRLAALRADQQRRWDQGERVLAEDYLRLLPDLDEDSSLALDVIYSEIRLRSGRGETIGESEYLQRFPSRAESLRQLFVFFRRMHDTSIAPAQAVSGETLPPSSDSLPTTTPTDPSLAPPGYEVQGKLGEGGMGVVYRARHLALNRIVALKVLKGTDAEDLERFRGEAEMIARLQHPNIVQVFEIGEHRGQPFLTQELVEGGTLADLLAKEPLAAQEAARLVEELARAVQHAHDRGVIHRDLKPGNVLLANGRTSKVTDFGLARRLGEDVRRTVSGVILGTPSYMPPEQAGGDLKAVGPLSDVYSLGAILYECLTGRPPFHTANVFQTILLVRTEDPVPPQRLQPGVPRDLDTICLKCLRKKPETRYASAAELADDLRRFQNGEPIQARPVGRLEKAWRWCRRKPALAALLAVVFVALFVLLPALVWNVVRAEQAQSEREHQQQLNSLLEREKDAEKRARATAEEVARLQQYNAGLRQVQLRNARRPFDWKRQSLKDLAELASLNVQDKDVVELRKQAAFCLGGLDLGPGRVLLEQFNAHKLLFTPDGKFLVAAPTRAGAFGLGDALRLIELSTGKVAHLLEFEGIGSTTGLTRFAPDGIRALACSSDGSWVAVGTRGGAIHCWRLPPTGKKPLLSLTLSNQADEPFLCFPQGDRLLCAGSSATGTLKSWELPSGKELASNSSKSPLGGLTRSDHGHVMRTNDGLETLDPVRLTPVGAKHTLVGAGVLALHPGERLLAVSQGSGLVLFDRGMGAPVLRLPLDGFETAHTSFIDELQFSGCGGLLLSFSRGSDRRLRLWEVVSGELLLEVAGGSTGVLSAALSPDSRWLAVGSDHKVTLYALEGLRQQRYLGVQSHPVRAVSFSNRGVLATIATRPEANHGQRELLSWDRWEPRPTTYADLLSLEGGGSDSLAFHSREEGLALLGTREKTDLCRTAAGKPIKELRTSYARTLAFDPDGRQLWVAEEEGRVSAWSWPDGKLLRTWSAMPLAMRSGREQVNGLAVSGEWVAIACGDGVFHLLSCKDSQTHLTKQLNRAGLGPVALSPDNLLAAVGDREGQSVLLQLPDRAVVQTFRDHSKQVEAIAFSADGATFVTTGQDREVHFYRKQGGPFVRWLTLAFSTPVLGVRFHPDGKHVALWLQRERGVRLWNVEELRQGLAKVGLD